MTSQLETLAGRLRVAAALLGMTYAEAAGLVGTDAKTMGLWMRGDRAPENPTRLGPLAEKLGLPLAALTTGAGFPSIDTSETPRAGVLAPGSQHHAGGPLSALTDLGQARVTESQKEVQVDGVPGPDELDRLSLLELIRLTKGWVAGAEAFGADPKGTTALRRYLAAMERAIARERPRPAGQPVSRS